MQKQPGTRALLEGALLAALTIVMAVSIQFIPLVGLFLLGFWPLPVAVAYLRHGLKVGILSLAVAVILSTIILGPLSGFGVLSTVGTTGLALGYTYRKKLSSGLAFLVVSGASALTFVGALVTSYLFMGINLLTRMIEIIEQSNAMTREMFVRTGVSGQQLEVLDSTAKALVELARVTLPSALLAGIVFWAFINLLGARWVLGRLGYQSPAWLPFAEWRLPSQAIWVAFPAFGLILLASRSGFPAIEKVGLNLYLLLMIGFKVLGISVASYFLSRSRVPKALGIIILIYASILPFIGEVLAYLGLWDLALNLRRLGTRPMS